MPKRALIVPYVARATPLQISTAQPNGLPGGTQGVPYVSALAATGGKAPYSWAKVSGTAWINVDAFGNVTGTPTAAGPVTLTASVTDANHTTVQGTWNFQIQSASTSANPIGANMDFSAFGSTRGFAFTQDGVLQSRGFTQSGSISTPVALTGAGWPAADFAVILVEGQRVQSWMPGTWKCGFTGTGNETISSNGSCTISKTSAPGNPHVTFNLTTNANIVSGAILGNYVFGFVVTSSTGGATNVYAYLPAYGANAATNQHQTIPLWTNEMIGIYGHMAAIRYMQSSGVINNNSTCTSANRNTPANCVTIAGAPGTLEQWAQEYFAAMSSAAGARHWMNMPIGADNTYYASALAGVAPFMGFAGGAGTCSELIVEISNELWNGAGAGESGGLNALANAYNTANPGVLNYDGSNSQVTLSYRWLALRLHDLTVAARTQFGAGNVGIGGPVRIAFMTQAAAGGWATFIPTVLNFLEHQYAGLANQWVHALGADTYVYRNNTSVPGDGTNWEGTSGTPAAIQAEWTRHAQYGTLLNFNEGIKLWCLRYGMRFYSYEGISPGRIDPGTPDNSIASVGTAIQDAGMNATTQTLVQQKLNCGHDLLIDYSSAIDTGTAAVSPGYCWDNLDTTLLANTTPRFQGLQAFSSGGTPVCRNQVTGSSSALGGTEYADNTAAMSSTNAALTQFSGSGIFGPYEQAWLFQVTAAGAGTYDVFLTYAGSGTINAYIDGQKVVTALAVPSGASPLKIISAAAFAAGFHSVEIGTGSFQNITVTNLTFNTASGGTPAKGVTDSSGKFVIDSSGKFVVHS